jgi:hypothetical protein
MARARQPVSPAGPGLLVPARLGPDPWPAARRFGSRVRPAVRPAGRAAVPRRDQGCRPADERGRQAGRSASACATRKYWNVNTRTSGRLGISLDQRYDRPQQRVTVTESLTVTGSPGPGLRLVTPPSWPRRDCRGRDCHGRDSHGRDQSAGPAAHRPGEPWSLALAAAAAGHRGPGRDHLASSSGRHAVMAPSVAQCSSKQRARAAMSTAPRPVPAESRPSC